MEQRTMVFFKTGIGFLLAVFVVGFCGCGKKTIPPIANRALHQGWSNVQAIGAKTPLGQAVGLPSEPASITISWNEMLVINGPISSYRIYRAESSGAEDFLHPLATDLSSSTKSYKDTTVVLGVTYYYVVRPVVNGQELSTSQNYSEIKVLTPPENMSLVHRWIANQEMCSLMGRFSDLFNNGRCVYNGPGNIDGYFDLGKSLLFDTVEAGCNYTPAPGCGDAVNGCLGVTDPAAATGVDGDVFYDRKGAHCFSKALGVWRSQLDPTMSSLDLAHLITNKPGAPPLVYINQTQSANACLGVNINGITGIKRLPTHKEQLLAMAWAPGLSFSDIDALSSGSQLPTTGNCNLNSGDGLTFDDQLVPNDPETLPCTFASTCQLVRTGSNSTTNCKTRYGMQDMVGNVHEWSSDQLSACDATTHTCTATTSTMDALNTDWSGIVFDNTMSFSTSPRIQLPLGIPLAANAPASLDSMLVGTGAGAFDSQNFRLNLFRIETDLGSSIPARGAFSGGSFFNAAGSGRFSISVRNPTTTAGLNVGFRCVMSAE